MKSKKNISASVSARLLNLSRSTSQDFNALTVRYVIERFLARLAISEYHNRFILKGAMLFIPWNLNKKRTTMDLDLLGTGNPSREELLHIVQEICNIEMFDGLSFDKKQISIIQIREKSVYDDIRLNIKVTLGKMTIKLQIDIGLGDQVFPEPKYLDFPTLLDKHHPKIMSYSPETVIAEKFNAMVVLGMANSRMKDYYDIWMLSNRFSFQSSVLATAICKTFHTRQTSLLKGTIIGLSDEFARNETKSNQWKGFIQKQRILSTVPDFFIIISSIRELLLPIVSQIKNNKIIENRWFPGEGWR